MHLFVHTDQDLDLWPHHASMSKTFLERQWTPSTCYHLLWAVRKWIGGGGHSALKKMSKICVKCSISNLENKVRPVGFSVFLFLWLNALLNSIHIYKVWKYNYFSCFFCFFLLSLQYWPHVSDNCYSRWGKHQEQASIDPGLCRENTGRSWPWQRLLLWINGITSVSF